MHYTILILQWQNEDYREGVMQLSCVVSSFFGGSSHPYSPFVLNIITTLDVLVRLLIACYTPVGLVYTYRGTRQLNAVTSDSQ